MTNLKRDDRIIYAKLQSIPPRLYYIVSEEGGYCEGIAGGVYSYRSVTDVLLTGYRQGESL
jgi:hypothetical protein